MIEPFEGVIGRTEAESTPWWPSPPHPGTAAPNVVVILLDDLGFAQLGCYGSDIDTPNIDRLAESGLRYTNFHVTPLCSPTRAALLTGRNHHSVGMRSVSNFNSGYPHMRGHISNHAATLAEVLREAGYTTFGLGKWHLCQMADTSAAGPFDQWPLQRGFDRYYGFLDGETDQFSPELVVDNHAVEPPKTAAEGYHLSEDLVDQAIQMIHDTRSIRPDRPFFTYLAFGATHSPHQAPPEYLEKYRGRYDAGWDDARQRWFTRQLEMGLLPEGTQLAPRNPGVDAWDDLPADQRQVAARLQEAFAGFLDHTDAQIGRLLDTLEALDQRDNTIVMLLADNGASQEGGPFGVMHEMQYFNFIFEEPAAMLEHLHEVGGPNSHTNYPWGWAQAGNTPFKWYKQNTHEGGVHVPLIVSWPAQIAEAGGVRHQFHHVNDLAPTIYEAAGITPPSTYRGLAQIPVSGTSLGYTFPAEGAQEPSRKHVQYFEMMGHRAIHLDGWKAVTRHQQGVPFADDPWELYHVEVDPSECNDLAAEMPEKVAELVERWWQEAEEHGVLPLDERTLELFGARFREHTPHPPERTYTYLPPMSHLPPQAAAALGGRSWDLAATIDRPDGAEGVLYASGDQNSGLTVFVQGGRLVFDYNAFGAHTVVRSEVEVPVGGSVVGMRLRREGQSGSATLVIDGADVGSAQIPRVMGMLSSAGASVGYDAGTAVSPDYEGPFRFTGTLERVEIQLVSNRPAEDQAAAAAEQAVSDARQ